MLSKEDSSSLQQESPTSAFQRGLFGPKEDLSLPEEAQGKFSPNWEGLYVVKKALSGGALILTEMDDDVFPEPINSDSVKRFYA